MVIRDMGNWLVIYKDIKLLLLVTYNTITLW